MSKKFSLPEAGLEVTLDKFARQAHGAVWIKAGDNIVLSTAVATEEPKEFLGFFPLTIQYRERTSAVGKIPGGFIKREGRLSDVEVLTSRLVDRTIRPLFPEFYFNEVQSLSTVYSSDGNFPPEILAVIGTSLALTISKIPFLGPIGAVQASKINDEWKFNLGHAQTNTADSSIIIAGTENGICMVEGYCNSIPEDELLDLLFSAHEQIKIQIDWQKKIQKEFTIVKAEPEHAVDWDIWKKKIQNLISLDSLNALFGKTKTERSNALNLLLTDIFKTFSEDINNGQITKSIIIYLFNKIISELLPDIIAQKQSRIDNRKFDEVRSILTEVSVLPRVHGSALFQRGETQALASITLGTAQDAQKVETLMGGLEERSFMLHYNFPPFATGEVKPMRAVGRREIGHGYLASNSFFNVLPSQENFPYTIRSVVDVLESNGSSSMATVCSTTMALMDAGIPIKDMIGGLAMGLIKDSSGQYHVITDILGMEDALGLMDFKVAGTMSGITAFQLDVKDKSGLSRQLLKKALAQALEGRLFILREMQKVLSSPRKEISNLAPRIFSFKVPQDKIGTIIGPSGKTIRAIVTETETQIDIDDDGTVKIYSKEVNTAKKAEFWIKTLVGDIEIDSIYMGTVRRISDFGIFVELVPGKEGLVHISTIAKSKQRILNKITKIGNPLKVRVTAHDKETGRIRLVASELERSPS